MWQKWLKTRFFFSMRSDIVCYPGVFMPNHVHTIIETEELWPLDGIIHSWKSHTSHKSNKLLHRSGEFWFREYHDRYIRDEEHSAKAIDYVENNPVKAGLVRFKEEWRWSSAKIRQ